MWHDPMMLIAPLLVIVAILWAVNGEHSMNYYQRDVQKSLWRH
ncbi:MULTISPECIES: hypothetical protein [unclassified Mycobacteroides]|nr:MULTISPECIES: hypothetical protein [unclassified Mycobacteroides]